MPENIDVAFHDEFTTNSTNLFKIMLEHATVIAREKGHKAQGMNALYVLFADRFGWTPAQVRSLSHEEMELLMNEFFNNK